MKKLALLIWLLSCGVVNAQDMHIDVQPDKIVMSDGQFMPRFVNLPNRLVVNAGQTFTLAADSTFDIIEVAGTLNSPAGNWIVRTTHFIILPGGTINLSAACGNTGRIIIQDKVIDTAIDPFQWGNGLVSFGTRNMMGCPMERTWAIANDSLTFGQNSINLTVPKGWRNGDDLIIPDTRQAQYAGYGEYNYSRREAPVKIQASTSTSIALSKPLDFEHTTITDLFGGIVAKPRIANLTRNLTIESENPSGTPGHVANVGHDAKYNVQYVGFIKLGRTKNIPLNSTPTDMSSTGTNQAGRYNEHDHHIIGFGSTSRGNAYIGNNDSKWARAVHRSSDTLSEDNVAVDFPGGCWIYEDGPEVRNVSRRDFCAYSSGNNQVIHGAPPNNINLNCPACDGAAFWSRSGSNIFDSVEGWNNRYGQVLLNQPIATRIPSTPGGPIDSDLPFRPINTIINQVYVSNNTAGMDFWAQPLYIMQNPILANNMATAIDTGPLSDTTGVGMVNPKIICNGGYYSVGMQISRPYIDQLVVDGGLIHGCIIGVAGGGGRLNTNIKNVSMGSLWWDLDFTTAPDGPLNIEQVKHSSGSWELLYGGQQPFIPGTPSGDVSNCKHRIINFDETGFNYCLSGEVAPPIEICGDGIDNDGDGLIDENPPCVPIPVPVWESCPECIIQKKELEVRICNGTNCTSPIPVQP